MTTGAAPNPADGAEGQATHLAIPALAKPGLAIDGDEDPLTASERHLRFDGPVNFRDLGGYSAAGATTVRWRTIFRSDGLERLSAADRRRLVEDLRLGVVIDLRSPREIADRGAFPVDGSSVEVFSVPILEDTSIVVKQAGDEFRMTGLLTHMIEACSDRFVEALRVMSTAEGPLVFHCAAGKDRTGMLAGLLLSLLGVAESDIVTDYGYSRRSAALLRQRWQRRVAAGQIDATTATVGDAATVTSTDLGSDEGIDTSKDNSTDPGRGTTSDRGKSERRRRVTAELFSAEPETLAAALAFVRDRHGSIEGWALDHGFTADDLTALRSRLLEPSPTVESARNRPLRAPLHAGPARRQEVVGRGGDRGCGQRVAAARRPVVALAVPAGRVVAFGRSGHPVGVAAQATPGDREDEIVLPPPGSAGDRRLEEASPVRGGRGPDGWPWMRPSGSPSYFLERRPPGRRPPGERPMPVRAASPPQATPTSTLGELWAHRQKFCERSTGRNLSVIRPLPVPGKLSSMPKRQETMVTTTCLDRRWKRAARGGLAVVVGAGVMAAGAGAAARVGADDGDRSEAVKAAVQGGQARNVIFFLGDGMGDSEITIGRNYGVGAAGHLAGIDALPLTGEYTTYAVKKGTADTPDYVTDSAASGTGWSTGTKTYNGAIAVDPVDQKPLETILEKAQAAGYRTGNVTTAELSDATPAVLDSHVSNRGCQGPEDTAKTCPTETKAAGGLGSIAEQTVDHNVDVLLGGGKARFAQTISGGDFDGQTVIDQATASGYTVVGDAAGLAATTPDQKVLGLFADVNMPQEFAPLVAQPWPASDSEAKPCEANPDYGADVPHLTDMTQKALDLLDAQTAEGDKGFFLQVEGASIDKRDHASDACGQIGETLEFDRAIQAGLAYAKDHPDTLVIVTADHGHTSQIVEAQTEDHHSPGRTATVLTKDGQPMTINYATVTDAKGEEQSQDHTGTEVRIAAQGPQAANVVGVINQTDVFGIMSRALGLS